ncbi:traF protein [Escherichia coli DEC7C]|nr:traF protein [Escherichia coli DEC7C]
MNKALLPLLLCCFIFPASGKDAGWQWYNEKINPKEKENKPVPAAPRQEPDIMQKLAALQTATKRALYEAILYPGVDNFCEIFPAAELLDSAGRAFHHERQKSHAGASRTGL